MMSVDQCPECSRKSPIKPQSRKAFISVRKENQQTNVNINITLMSELSEIDFKTTIRKIKKTHTHKKIAFMSISTLILKKSKSQTRNEVSERK